MNWRDLLSLFRSYGSHRIRLYRFGLLVAVLSVVTEALPPVLVGKYMESLVTPTGGYSIQTLGLLLMGTYLAAFAAHTGHALSHYYLMALMTRDLRSQMFAAMQRAVQMNLVPGDMQARLLDDVVEAQSLLTTLPLMTVANLVWLGMIIGVLAIANLYFLALGLAAVPTYFLVAQVISRKLTRMNRQLLLQKADLAEDLSESLDTKFTTRAFGLEDYWSRRFVAKLDRFFGLRLQVIRWQALAQSGAYLVSHLLPASLLLYGGHLILEGRMGIATLVTSYVYAARVFVPLEALSQLIARAYTAWPALERVRAVINSEPERTSGSPLRVRQGIVEFVDVTFGYDPARPVLKDFSAQWLPGVLNVVVGPNGVGKSTLVSLVLGIYQPHAGRVQMDGADIGNCLLADLRHQIAVATPQAHLLNASVIENIQFGSLNKAPDALRSRAGSMGIEGLIADLVNGWEATTGRRGSCLSAGQSQRVALARALARDTPILIIDEGTAHLDRAAEEQLYGRLRDLISSKTVVVMTHKLPRLDFPYRVIDLTPAVEVESE